MGCPHQRLLDISSLPYIWHSDRHQKGGENRPWVLSPRNSQLCRRRRVKEQVNYRYHCLCRTAKGKGKNTHPWVLFRAGEDCGNVSKSKVEA